MVKVHNRLGELKIGKVEKTGVYQRFYGKNVRRNWDGNKKNQHEKQLEVQQRFKDGLAFASSLGAAEIATLKNYVESRKLKMSWHNYAKLISMAPVKIDAGALSTEIREDATPTIFFDDFESGNFGKWEGVWAGAIVPSEKGLSATMNSSGWDWYEKYNLFIPADWEYSFDMRILKDGGAYSVYAYIFVNSGNWGFISLELNNGITMWNGNPLNNDALLSWRDASGNYSSYDFMLDLLPSVDINGWVNVGMAKLGSIMYVKVNDVIAGQAVITNPDFLTMEGGYNSFGVGPDWNLPDGQLLDNVRVKGPITSPVQTSGLYTKGQVLIHHPAIERVEFYNDSGDMVGAIQNLTDLEAGRLVTEEIASIDAKGTLVYLLVTTADGKVHKVLV